MSKQDEVIGTKPGGVVAEDDRRQLRAETRKVQLLGGSTFAVSLPRGWIERLGVSPGDEVIVEPQSDGSLRLVAGRERRREPRIRTARVETRDPHELLRFIISLYVSGSDVMMLETSGPLPSAQRAVIDEACDRLLGLQVVEETPRFIMLQDLADVREFNAEKGLRMMQLHVHRMLVETQRLVTGESLPEVGNLARSEAELDRLLLFMMKQHNRLLQNPSTAPTPAGAPTSSLDSFLVALNLERIGDYATKLAAAPVLPRGSARATQLGGACSLAAKCVDDAMQAFHRRDAKLANDTIRLSHDLGDLSRAVPVGHIGEKGKAADLHDCASCVGFTHAFECFERIGLYAKSIAEVAINRASASAPPTVKGG